MLPPVPAHRDRRFVGYVLDSKGVPEFRYRDGGGEVTVRIVPTLGGNLVQTTTRGGVVSKAEVTWE